MTPFISSVVLVLSRISWMSGCNFFIQLMDSLSSPRPENDLGQGEVMMAIP
jgi:hypothetical protein